MKKLILILLVFIILCSCNKNDAVVETSILSEQITVNQPDRTSSTTLEFVLDTQTTTESEETQVFRRKLSKRLDDIINETREARLFLRGVKYTPIIVNNEELYFIDNGQEWLAIEETFKENELFDIFKKYITGERLKVYEDFYDYAFQIIDGVLYTMKSYMNMGDNLEYHISTLDIIEQSNDTVKISFESWDKIYGQLQTSVWELLIEDGEWKLAVGDLN